MRHNIGFFVFILIAVFTSGNLGAQSSADTQVLLSRAEAAFKEGNELLPEDPEAAADAYRVSVESYNSILKAGRVNAGLYYNAGNAYLRLGEEGRAILNYRRALLYSPNDHQIKYNLDYARSLQRNGFSISAGNEVLHILFFWHYMLPSLWKAIFLMLANLVLWTAVISGRLGRPAGRVALVSLVIVLAAGVSLYLDLRNSRILHAVVTAESTIGRFGDSRSYEPAFDTPLYQGVEFTVRQRRVGWLLAELPNGEIVWVEEQDCGIVEEELIN